MRKLEPISYFIREYISTLFVRGQLVHFQMAVPSVVGFTSSVDFFIMVAL